MSDALARFITDHRSEFDVFQPSPALWARIEQGLTSSMPPVPKTGKQWWFTASVTAVVVATTIYFAGRQPSSENESSPEKQIVMVPETEETEPKEANLTPIENVATVEEVQDEYVPEKPEPVKTVGVLPEIPKKEPAPNKPEIVERDREQQYKVEKPENAENKKSREPVQKAVPSRAPKDVAVIPPDTTEKKREKPSRERTKSKRKEKVNSGKDGYHQQIGLDTSFTGIRRLEIETSSSEVKFLKGSGNILKFRGEADVQARGIHNMKDNGYQFKCRRDGDVLHINAGCQENTKLFIGVLLINSKMEIELPEGIEEVILQDISGDVTMDAFEGKRLNLMTTSGNIKAGEIKGNISLTSTSGDIKVASATGKLEIHATSGDVVIDEAGEDTDVSCFSGDVVAGNLHGQSSLKTTSGNVNVKMFDGKLRAASYSGDVNVNAGDGELSVSTTSGNISCSQMSIIANSDFASFSGDVLIELKDNRAGDFNFDLSSFSGNLNIDWNGNQSSGERKLTLGSGRIDVKASTTSGNIMIR